MFTISIAKWIEVVAPPSIIWQIITRHLEHPEQPDEPSSNAVFIRGIGGVPLSENRKGLGVRTRWTYEFKGRRYTWDDEVTRWDEGRLIEWKATSSWQMIDSFEFIPMTTGTRVLYRMRYRFPYGPLGWLIAHLFYHRHITRSLDDTLQRLKASAERIAVLHRHGNLVSDEGDTNKISVS